MKYFDKIHDFILYALILLCFVTAGWGIIQTITGNNKLFEVSVLMLFGIGCSLYFVWLKSKQNNQ